MKLAFSVRRHCAVLAGSAAMAFGGQALAAPSYQLTSGATEVELSAGLLAALDSLGVAAGGVLPAGLTAEGDAVIAGFPIPTGELDAGTVKLEVIHSGGLTLSAGDTKVALTSFIIDNLKTNNPVLTGIVKANDTVVGRIPLFVVNIVTAPTVIAPVGEGEGQLRVRKARLKLTAAAADALNGAFGLDGAFTEGFPIGLAQITATLRDND